MFKKFIFPGLLGLVVLAALFGYLGKTQWLHRDGIYHPLHVISIQHAVSRSDDFRVWFSKLEKSRVFGMKETLLLSLSGIGADELLKAVQSEFNRADSSLANKIDGDSDGIRLFMTASFNGEWAVARFEAGDDSDYVRFFPDMNSASYRVIRIDALPEQVGDLIKHK